MRLAFFVAMSLTATFPAYAETAPAGPAAAAATGEFGVPVYPYNITDRAYVVVGEVQAGVRKATVFSKSPSQEKIYRELWERAKKLGADAVIKAQYGDAHVSAMSWGKTNATGVAIKFAPAVTTSVPPQSAPTN